jgi:hypothetical protein
MTTITHAEYAKFDDCELAAFQAKVWQSLTPATAVEARYGQHEILREVAMIVDKLPSARRHDLDTSNSPNWQGHSTIAVVVMSADDQARVPALVRAWRKAS